MLYLQFGIKASSTPRSFRLATLLAFLALAVSYSEGQNPTGAPTANPVPTAIPVPTVKPGATPIEQPLPFRLDHFLCYLVQPQQFQGRPGLTMTDQFHPKPSPFALVNRELLCNPVSKNQEPVHNKQAHLTGYGMKSPEAQPLNIPVIVINQFGKQQFVVGQENRFLVPTGKSRIGVPTTAAPPVPPIPQGLDHFACYTVKAESAFQPRRVVLADQFGRLESEVFEPLFLCNPAQKMIENRPTGPIINARDHLMCYGLKAGSFQPRKVQIHDQFENIAVEAARPDLLCVPSLKERTK